jgi:hypothetical protein
VVGFAVELDHSMLRSVHTMRMVFPCVLVNIGSVNTGRRYLVTKARWACSNEMLCRARG